MAPLVGSSTGSVALEPRLTALPADSAPQMTMEAAADATGKKTRRRIDKTAVHREIRLMRREHAVAHQNFEARMVALEKLTFMEPDNAAAAEQAAGRHTRSARGGARTRRSTRSKAKFERGVEASVMPVSPWAPSTPVVSRNPLADMEKTKMVTLVEEMDKEVEEKEENEDSSGGGRGTRQQKQQKQNGTGEGWRRRMRRLEDELSRTKADADALRARLGEALLDEDGSGLTHPDPYQQECLLREEVASERIKSGAAREEAKRWKEKVGKMESAVVRLRGELEGAKAEVRSAREAAEAERAKCVKEMKRRVEMKGELNRWKEGGEKRESVVGVVGMESV